LHRGFREPSIYLEKRTIVEDSPLIVMTKSAYLLSVVIISLVFMMSGAGAQGMKIGIVDMNRVFAEYYKTKDADKVVNEQKEAAKKELETINNEYKKLLDSYQKLAKEIKDPAIGEELRKKKQNEAKEVASKARALEREKKELSDRRQRMLLTEVDRKRKSLIEEIQDVVGDMAKKKNYDIVFDKSGLGTRGIPFLLHSKDAVDFSEELIGILNKNASSP
jgi:outer membrane protein